MIRLSSYWFVPLIVAPLGLWALVLAAPPTAKEAPQPAARPEKTPAIYDTEKAEGIEFSTPQQALESIELPSGFRATLFAAEPDVRQPIAITTDGRGRLWVAENYTYAERPTNYDRNLRDRVIVLEDTDGDGASDRRTVFWDKAVQLTSVEVGFGGVWLMCPPQLLFIPDVDGDLVPDGRPVVLLDGFNNDAIRHNIANGLRWGPDGWLYGRHGITTTSRVGPPDAPDSQRTTVHCGLWRYHPTKKNFEVVCHGTTNPWGHDWDDHGQLFFINTVIGHLWHVVPGAHYERMYGEDGFSPHLYSLIPQTADHFHWDTRQKWSDIRDLGVTSTTDEAGGGHAHTGMMIYLGDNWPERYRNEVFTVNLHGRRVNCDRIERHGATYVGRHEADFMQVGDVWFRGLELLTGADGGVYVADWSDVGECHENDGVHRTSGRIFKVVYDGEGEGGGEAAGGSPSPRPSPKGRGGNAAGDDLHVDVDSLSDEDLVALQLHASDWYCRQARRVLQERSVAGRKMAAAREALLAIFKDNPDVTRRLRALWCLYSMGAIDPPWLVEQLTDENEHIRTWAVKLLVDQGSPDGETVAALKNLSIREQSGLVLTFLASALQRLKPPDRWPIAAALAAHQEFADDPVLPRMIWYGLEAVVPGDPDQAVSLAYKSQMPLVRRHVARRLGYLWEQNPQQIAALLAPLADEKHAADRPEILGGMADALRGWDRATMPAGWDKLSAAFDKDSREEIRQTARELSVLFGDGRATGELLTIASSDDYDFDARRRAIATLVLGRNEQIGQRLVRLLNSRELGPDAIRGLAVLDYPKTPDLILGRFADFREASQTEAIAALASRPAYARRLIAAIDAGQIDRGLVNPFLVRQMLTFEDEELTAHVTRLWPQAVSNGTDTIKKIAELRGRLSSEVLAKADASSGRQTFDKTCGKCHKLFGQGGAIGPELTGAQRANLHYILENVLDPSATLADNYRMSVLQLADGRVINGLIVQDTGTTLEVQTPDEKLTIRRDEVEAIRASQLSLMPTGLLDPMTAEQVRDLVAYLMSPRQVPLPEGATSGGE